MRGGMSANGVAPLLPWPRAAAEPRAHALPRPAEEPRGRPPAGRRGRDRRTDEPDPAIERQRAGDEAGEAARHRRLDPGAVEREGEQRHEVERLDGLADALRDLA